MSALTPEQERKLGMIEAMGNERHGAQKLLAKINELFPLEKEMKNDPGFKGAHSLTLKPDGTLQLNVWIGGLVYPVWFT